MSGVISGALSTANPKSKNKGMGGLFSSLLGAGSNLLGGILNESFSDKHTKDAQNFALMQGDISWDRAQQAFGLENQRADEVWNRQRQWDLEKWNMENQYNSPAMQMARFKEAGLNPNLIYGQSNAGGNIASGNLGSGSLDNASSSSPNRVNGTDWVNSLSGIGNSLMNYVQFRKESETVDNVRAQTELSRKEGILKGVQTAGELLKNKGVLADNTRKEIENYIEGSLKEVSVDTRKRQLAKIEQDMDFASQRNEREIQMQYQQIQESLQRVNESKSKENLNDLEAQIKDLQIMLLGTGPRATELIDRMGGKWLQSGYEQIQKKYEQIKNNRNTTGGTNDFSNWQPQHQFNSNKKR